MDYFMALLSDYAPMRLSGKLHWVTWDRVMLISSSPSCFTLFHSRYSAINASTSRIVSDSTNTERIDITAIGLLALYFYSYLLGLTSAAVCLLVGVSDRISLCLAASWVCSSVVG